MGSLYFKKSVHEIKTCKTNINWIKIINKVFADNKYKFCLNSELIDTDNRFRIVKINRKIYVVKKTSIKKGILERNNATKLYELLNGKIVDNLKIVPIVPIVVEIGENGYIISEYKGHTLQERLYDKRKSKIMSYSTFNKIISLLFREGILYRGFIPRNIILKKNTLYMIDYEDININSNSCEIVLNLQYLTNFILNWQYFYAKSDLEKLFKTNDFVDEDNIELLPFERCYKDIIGRNYNNYELRTSIINTVLNSEKPCELDNKKLYRILPVDYVHLLSDLYGDYLDVLIDLFFEKFRNNDEMGFISFLDISSSIIQTNYCDIDKLRKDLFSLLIITIKLFVNHQNINKKNICEVNATHNDIELIAKLLLKELGSNSNDTITHKIVDILKNIGGKYELF